MGSQTYVIGPTGIVGNAQLGGQPVIRPHQNRAPVTLFNTGTTTIYLETDQQNTGPGAGQPLSPGSVQPWDAGLGLWAACPTAGTLLVSDNSQSPFDAGAIASQILGQGLAQDIANAIYITGAPPVDKYTLLDDSGVFSGTGYVSGPIDTTGYQSIEMGFANSATRIVPGRVSIQWYATNPLSPSSFLGYDEFIVGTGTNTQFITSVKGPFFQIVVDGGGTITGGGQLKTYGSYKVAASTLYKGIGNGTATGSIDGSTDLGVQTWSGNIPISTTWLWQPGVVAGDSHLSLRWTTAGTTTYLLRVPTNIFPLTTYLAASNAAVTSGETDLFDVFLPPVPLELSIANLSTTATLNFRATLTTARPYVS